MHVQDEISLDRMLGSIPDEVREECDLRTKMFHCDGNSGPLGSLGLIDMLRSMRLGPRKVEEKPEVTIWRNLPQDGSVRVEARYFGAWMPGVFRGFVEGGTLAVQLDEEPEMKECSPSIVRRASSPPPTVPFDPDEPAPEEPMDESGDESTEAFDWTTLVKGHGVWVEEDSEIKDAVFDSVAKDGKIVVLVEGEEKPRAVDIDIVTPGEPGKVDEVT